MIIIVEIIKRSRLDEGYVWGRLKWAVDKSKGSVKSMSRQLEEGNPYCTAGDSGKSRVWPKGPRGPRWEAATSDSTNTFIYGTETLSPLLSPLLVKYKRKSTNPEMVKCAVKTP